MEAGIVARDEGQEKANVGGVERPESMRQEGRVTVHRTKMSVTGQDL